MRNLLLKLFVLLVLVLATNELLAFLLKKGLDRGYGFHRSARIVIIGNSRIEAGVDRDMLEQKLGIPVAKYSIGGINPADRLIMLKHFLSENMDVKYVVYGVDQYTFQMNRYRGAEDPYRRMYPYIDNEIVGQYVRQCVGSWEEYVPRYLLKLLRYNNQLTSFSVSQLLNMPEKEYTGHVNVAAESSVLTAQRNDLYRSSISEEGIKLFDETLRYASGQGCRVILLFVPTTDILNRLNADNYQRTLQLLSQLSKKYSESVTLIDTYTALGDDYSLFGDLSHLNRQGQVRLSEDFASYLSNWISLDDSLR